ncbi:hypothetical protein CES86_3584 [Brucella lupini]|uniref:Uncharacterized protein n=1 Tax=Brucella lupini TaxID=255457 RepID=A0A256GHM6_9HYPH|nr:hypothetical protein CES86_3584 [Brucella lupini]
MATGIKSPEADEQVRENVMKTNFWSAYLIQSDRETLQISNA